MAQSALRALTQQLMQGGPSPSGMASYQTAVQNAANRPQPKPIGQQMADVLGGVSLPLSPVPIVGDIAGLGADAAMYAAYPEERTLGNAAMTLAGIVPGIPGAAAVKAGLDMSQAARMQRADEGALDVAQAPKYVANKMPTGVYSVAGNNAVYSVKPSGNEFIIEYIPQWKSKAKPFQVQGGSIDEVVSLADQRLDRSFNAIKGSAKYQNIPEAWTGEAKKIAKKAIDAGYDPIFSASTQSRSKYMEINGQKIRLSDHDLPLHYDAPDIDFRYGSDIDALLSRLQGSL